MSHCHTAKIYLFFEIKKFFKKFFLFFEIKKFFKKFLKFFIKILIDYKSMTYKFSIFRID
jgi:predicted secreted protein